MSEPRYGSLDPAALAGVSNGVGATSPETASGENGAPNISSEASAVASAEASSPASDPPPPSHAPFPPQFPSAFPTGGNFAHVVPPKPKPIITPERTADGWSTPSLKIRREGPSYYITLHPALEGQVIRLSQHQVEQLAGLIEAPAGELWRRLSEIPLERPLPSRAMEEELRVLLRTFGREILQQAPVS